MKKIRLSFASLILSLIFMPALRAQPKSETFYSFGQRYDSLFLNAYNQKDPKRYEKLLSEFLHRYKSQPDSVKKWNAERYVNAYYNLCCTYSVLNDKEPALDNLQRALNAGFRDYVHTFSDSDLNNIRHEARYASILQPLKETADYPYILKKAADYNRMDARLVPAFTYQPATEPHLQELRRAFNLDSIAGKGNDVSRILNLMHWIHNLVPHDGSSLIPEARNAMGLIALCKQERRGLNCRGMSTVLNECYLAMGIPSRFVTCLPKDSLGIDNDCHVINMVYAKSLQKWIWVDATFDAYVMNEKGELLGIQEVRDRLTHNQALILSPEANWNHKNSQTLEYYLGFYMSKNLYMVECLADSKYDAETAAADGKQVVYITLLPTEYYKQTPDKSENKNRITKMVYINYKTNNPDVFWAPPPAN